MTQADKAPPSNITIHGDCIDELPKIMPGTVDLVIADPPYWKVIGEKWDYEWRTQDEYLEWCFKWIEAVAAALRYGGTFYLFGYFRTLALITPHLEAYGLELRQQILIDKGMRAVSGRATKKYKLFPNTTESILFIVKDNKKMIKPFLLNKKEELGYTAKQINELLGVKSNGGGMWSIYTGKNVCEQFPTKKLWDRLQLALQFEYPYEKLAQTFNPQMGLTDIWRDIDFYEEKRIHPTQKPGKLIDRLIAASSNPNDLVLDPFAGSGSTAAAALKSGRKFITIEKDPHYYNHTAKRVDEHNNPLKDLITS